MFFDAFRAAGGPTYYSSNKTAVTWDVLVAGFIFAFLVIAVTFYALLPGFRGWQRTFTCIRISLSLFIGASIMIPNFGQSWEVSRISNVATAYKAGRGGEIHADVGVKIGLRAVNITLKGIPEHQDSSSDSPAAGERVNYNERFYFDGRQGRNGFGRYAGRINREFRQAQYRGLPYPILWVAEYFTLDGEDIRWGRSYRHAGYYTSGLMWLAFALWLIVNILLVMGALNDGLWMLFLTGSSMLGANVLYATVRYGSPLVIPFSSDHVLRFTYGWSFYLCLVGGLVAVMSSLVCLTTLFFFPDETEVFFGVKEETENRLEYYQRRARETQAARDQWATVTGKVIAISRANGNGLNVSYVQRQKSSRRRKLSDLMLAVREFGKEKVVSEDINSINI